MRKVKKSRVNFSIKKSFQLKLIFRILFIILLGTAVTSGVFYFYANREIGSSFKHFHVSARNFLDYLFPAIMASGGLGVLVAIVVSVFFPHSIAGPLYRIERDLKEKIGEGDLTIRFHLRNGDDLKELADNLNEVLEKTGSKIKNIESASGELSRLMLSNNSLETEGLKEAREKLTSALNKFKLS